jgi:hypothetical protein
MERRIGVWQRFAQIRSDFDCAFLSASVRVAGCERIELKNSAPRWGSGGRGIRFGPSLPSELEWSAHGNGQDKRQRCEKTRHEEQQIQEPWGDSRAPDNLRGCGLRHRDCVGACGSTAWFGCVPDSGRGPGPSGARAQGNSFRLRLSAAAQEFSCSEEPVYCRIGL